eukprot:jgi/Hompol1/1998/HPOL_002838-RA
MDNTDINTANNATLVPLPPPPPPLHQINTASSPPNQYQQRQQSQQSQQQRDQRPKNVPEELKTFLQVHPFEWFTNEELAERLNHTPSGIRNAVTKLKNTGLIKTRMTGALAYRGWHTAPVASPLPVPDMQRRIAARQCNGCRTSDSKYWRSDLAEPNGWLCNNCGMNQRRGRGIQRIG